MKKNSRYREVRKERQAIDRAMLRCLRQLTWTTSQSEPLRIRAQDQAELVGLVLARRKAR